MKNGYRRFISPVYLINMIIQSIVTLVSPIGCMLFAAWLIDKYTEVGSWIYVVLILLGVFSGLYSMVVFILRASSALEALEKQNSEKEVR